MTPLHEVPDEELAGKAAEKMRRVREAGVDASFLRVLGSAPQVTEFYYGAFYEGLFFEGTVPLRLKELARLRLAGVHGCVPCQSLDVRSALSHGVSQAEIDAVWSRDASSFGEPERSVLELADLISFASPQDVASDDLVSRLQRHLTEEQIVELSMVCAVLSGAARMLLTLGLVEKSIQCELGKGHSLGPQHATG